MAVENLGKTVTFLAAGNLSAKQYRFMSRDSNGRVDVAGDGADAIGILQDDPSVINAPACVAVGAGISKIEAGAAFSNSVNLASDSVGRAITAATGDYIQGRALEAATAAGQIVSMLYKPRGSTAP